MNKNTKGFSSIAIIFSILTGVIVIASGGYLIWQKSVVNTLVIQAGWKTLSGDTFTISYPPDFNVNYKNNECCDLIISPSDATLKSLDLTKASLQMLSSTENHYLQNCSTNYFGQYGVYTTLHNNRCYQFGLMIVGNNTSTEADREKGLSILKQIFNTFKLTSAIKSSTSNQVSWKTYINRKYGYSFQYPADFTIFAGIDQIKENIIPPTSSNEKVSITDNKTHLFCCEPITTSFAVIPGEIDVKNWRQYYDIPNYRIKSQGEITFVGEKAYEVRASSGIDSVARLILIPFNLNSIVIFQGGEGEKWDSITNSFTLIKTDYQMDNQRISDLGSLQSSLDIYMSDGNRLSCVSGEIYTSLNGTTAINGAGWLPVDLTKISSGLPLKELPKDLINDSTSYYSFACDPVKQIFEFNAKLQGAQHEPLMAEDGGNNDNLYELGNALGLTIIK